MNQMMERQKRFRSDNKEKYPTNPSETDPRYIFDWDDYIAEQKYEAQKKESAEFYLRTIILNK